MAANCDYLQLNGNILKWKETLIESLQSIQEIVHCHRFVILEGPPGVGKTHFLKILFESGRFNHHTMLTFHASTEYNDFIGGLKPIISNQRVVSVSGMGRSMFRVINKPVLELKAIMGHFLQVLKKTADGPVLHGLMNSIVAMLPRSLVN